VLLSYYFAEDMDVWQTGIAVYNCETDTYERIIPGGCTYDDYPHVEKTIDFKWWFPFGLLYTEWYGSRSCEL